MTLSLDDVRSKRFRMARKSGYEVLEVDEFVDEVEATFEQLFEENQNLKKQVESLRTTAPAGSGADGATRVSQAETPAAAVAPGQPAERIVVTTAKEASSAVVRLVALTTEQSETLVAQASAEAAQIHQQATTSADRLAGEAKVRAERLQADALGRAESLDRETETRRTKMFGELEQQREQLTSTVHALRSFESTYRSNLTRHLQSQIEVLESGDAEPADPPAALADAAAPRRNGDAGAPSAPASTTRAPQPQAGRPAPAEDDTPTSGGGSAASDTPRLDALLGDQR